MDFFFQIEKDPFISVNEGLLVWLENYEPVDKECSFCGIIFLEEFGNIELYNLGSMDIEQRLFFSNVNELIKKLLNEIEMRLEKIE